ncbi:MAG: carbohydrate-binding protein, partial [Verrucomicrobiota bacterium]
GLLHVLCSVSSRAAVLPGFQDTVFASGFDQPVGIVFDDNGRGYVWEKGGKVWIVHNGTKHAEPLLDISEEVGNWRDFGMLGFALDPNFLSNGRIYCGYLVDLHHLKNFGSSNYDPNTNTYNTATISRVTRYTVNSFNGNATVDYESRKVLVGESASTGIPSMHQSHGIGSLAFGNDGTLLVSTGDGSSYSLVDAGSAAGTWWSQALSDGIIGPDENVGSYRSQMLGSLNGKILRIDPDTGDGVSSNPFYLNDSPRSAQSRVWALGLRNPVRMTVKPDSGSTNPDDAFPGIINVGDVGWMTREEMNTSTDGGENFGWPIYEGFTPHPNYSTNGAINPENGERFIDLIKQPFADHSVTFPSVNPNARTFIHARPSIDWNRSVFDMRTGAFNGNAPATVKAAGFPYFRGNCSIGGVWHDGVGFPPEYGECYYHGDFGVGWIMRVVMSPQNEVIELQNIADAPGIVHLTVDPSTNHLLYTQVGEGSIRRISYGGSSNLRPEAVASVNRNFGPSPLSVSFTGSNSSDPENAPLSYFWDFGDGSTSTQANPSHTFNVTGATIFNITLTVTDPQGATDSTTLIVSPNNSPPSVEITTFEDGQIYSLEQTTILELEANVSDESPESQLTYEWQTVLYHNNHFHAEPIDGSATTSTIITPTSCTDDYYYGITLTVTDPFGLQTSVEQFIYPDCAGSGANLGSGEGNGGNETDGGDEDTGREHNHGGNENPSSPYSGSPLAIPGRIQAEDFDLGGQNVAYWDADAANQGVAVTGLNYRPESVDIGPSNDTDGTPSVGWGVNGEWLLYTVSPEPGVYDIVLRAASGVANPGDAQLTLDGQTLGVIPVGGTGGWANWQDFKLENVTIGAGSHQILRFEFINGGAFNPNWIEFVPVNSGGENQGGNGGDGNNGNGNGGDNDNGGNDSDNRAYGGVPMAIPGRIQVENFDEGGQGSAYSDSEPENFGLTYEDFDYRSEGVDIERSNDTDGSPSIGWADGGEWLEFTIDVSPGTYDFNARVASGILSPGSLRAFLGGRELGTVNASATDGWYDWQTISIPNILVSESGRQTLRLEFAGNAGFNLNWVEFSNGDGNANGNGGDGNDDANGNDDGGGNQPSRAYGGVSWPLPGRIEAEDYDEGGEGVAYKDDEPANLGGEYRNDGVDIETSGDVENGYNVGWFDNDQWMEFTVNATPGTYRIDLRASSAEEIVGDVRIFIEGNEVGIIDVDSTGGWTNWETFTLGGVFVSGGEKVVRLEMEGDAVNVNWFEFVLTSTTAASVRHYVSQQGGSSVSDPASDDDGDGTSNFEEFAFGTDPTDRESKPEFHLDVEHVAGITRNCYTIPVLIGGTIDGATYTAQGVEYSFEASEDLGNWKEPVEIIPNPPGLPTPPAGYKYLSACFAQEGAECGFVRARISNAP